MKLRYLLILIIAGTGLIQPVLAQKMIRVTGTVYNTANKKKRVPFTDIAVRVYSCLTVAEGEDLQKKLDAENAEFMLEYDPSLIAETDQNGYYDIMVPDNGALVFKAGMNKPVMERVNGRMKIDVGIDDGLKIDEVIVTGIRTEIKPEPKNSRLVGNRFYPYNTFMIPAHTANNYSRLIIQPYVLNCSSDDTVAYCRPLIYDGEEFHLTQRRLKGNDLRRDPLIQWVNKRPLTTQQLNIEWSDTVIVPDPNGAYSCYADFVIEDYRTITYHKTYQVNTCENKRPMRFLQYSLLSKDLDFMQYRERAQVEKRNSADKVSLSFAINSNKLTDDPANQINLDKIKQRLDEIINAPGATLKEFHVKGVSSPEGSYAHNLALARSRMARIQSEVINAVPANIRRRVYMNPQASVAKWEEVVKLLQADHRTAEAEDIQEILEEYPQSIDHQGNAIKRLPYYKEVITPYLDKLRQVEYNVKYDIYREPTDEEVMDQYRKHGLKMEYTRYEYWKLFQMLTDSMEIENLARKAYDESLQMNAKHPWVLAGNILAAQYLKRDTFDVKILEPLIDKTIYMVNYERINIDTHRKEIVNPEEVVINQLCMYIKSGDFEQASIMAKILPERQELDLIKAFAWALGGYYQGGYTPEERARAKKTFELVKNSTPQNEVVMYLALENRFGNMQAEKSIAKLPPMEPLTWYFRATVAARKGDAGFTDAMMALSQCFQMDKKYITMAQNDGEFNKELIEAAMDMVAF